ncbi:hypothetical protein E8E12_009735 [Didymella heteroderae]|uniref:Uncharacterized protein n=1 Tax=Didymella heteroderae TaxID=1769908 RepID=A0A9P4X044_9PLEO|nr:hypothetical protein E8E12_009735 [Didymella heteroderae]
MQINKAKHLPPKLANAFSRARAKAKEKMTRKASETHSDQTNHSEGVVKESSSMSHATVTEAEAEQVHDLNALFSVEDKDDLEQMLKNDFAAFSAEEYQAEIQPLFNELLTFMNRQDALDRLG